MPQLGRFVADVEAQLLGRGFDVLLPDSSQLNLSETVHRVAGEDLDIEAERLLFWVACLILRLARDLPRHRPVLARTGRGSR